MTSLFDAIGKTLTSIDVKDAMVLIQTDGHENSSQEFKKEDIKKIIAEKEAIGYDFMFLGANIDAADVGIGFGLAMSKTSQFDATGAGVHDAYATMNASSTSHRMKKSAEFKLKQGNEND